MTLAYGPVQPRAGRQPPKARRKFRAERDWLRLGLLAFLSVKQFRENRTNRKNKSRKPNLTPVFPFGFTVVATNELTAANGWTYGFDVAGNVVKATFRLPEILARKKAEMSAVIRGCQPLAANAECVIEMYPLGPSPDSVDRPEPLCLSRGRVLAGKKGHRERGPTPR
jgi:hypothetical protein